jgi:hypothetical protein
MAKESEQKDSQKNRLYFHVYPKKVSKFVKNSENLLFKDATMFLYAVNNLINTVMLLYIFYILILKEWIFCFRFPSKYVASENGGGNADFVRNDIQLTSSKLGNF